MQNARTTLAIFAFAAIFGCTVQPPPSAPTEVQEKLQLSATESTFALTRDLTRRFADLYGDSEFNVTMQSYEGLLQQLDQGGISYFISSHVPAGAGYWAAPLAVDGLAFVVNQLNPLANIASDDLRRLLSGQIADWSELGAPAGPIMPFTFLATTDLYREVQRMLTGAIDITGNAKLAPNVGAMLDAVAEERGAIGFVPLSLADDRVRVLAIDGVAPGQAAMTEQRYPLRSTIYVIGLQEPPPAYRNLIGWIQSEAGQAIVAETHSALP